MQPLEPTCLNSDSHRGRIAECRDEREDSVHIVCYWHWHVKDAKTRVYVLDVQGSSKHEGEQPKKPGSQYRLGIIP